MKTGIFPCKQLLLPGLCAWFLLASCDKVIQHHPNEIRLEEEDKDLNAKNLALLGSPATADSFRFVVIGDSQRFYDELEDFIASVNNFNDISFVLLNGDITDFGLSQEFRWVSRKLRKLKFPFISVIGNHDMLANGRTLYREMFGAENFYFDYGNFRFLCVNTNSREDEPGEILPNLDWLRGAINATPADQRIIVFSHVPPFHADFDRALEKGYADLLSQSGRIPYSIHGHVHEYSLSQPYGPPVNYLVVGAMDDRNFVIVNINPDTIRVEQVFY